MMSSSLGGTVGFNRIGGSGVRLRIPSKMVAEVSPGKGKAPVAISYSTVPKENKSVRASRYTVPAGAASVGLYCQVYPTATGAATERFDDGFLTGFGGFGTHYYHGDHLGSARLMTDSLGNSAWSATYLPFGTDWNAQPTSNHYKFTGKERDTESGLNNFGARYNASTMGRWMSPDAINLTDERIFNPANTLNKYGYGGNN